MVADQAAQVRIKCGQLRSKHVRPWNSKHMRPRSKHALPRSKHALLKHKHVQLRSSKPMFFRSNNLALCRRRKMPLGERKSKH